ncbi:hypothetical protein E4P40_23125 [Blastococcus sp. CT_GayMR20]|uniref:DUF5667 domain-containing protein n=1 Tax=Blastococcus sp. CT_GayMR20 TaxID=2559609 RepID=UPI00107415FD|nr:DUF5667 domain-containing protein [Blastococcus sp. CT_GayMR20]TFV68642.1 hypothetical protein E4P40_23125 [Blastococcus sp. CT_GayMR20]
MSVRDREEAVVARLHELAPQLDGEPDPAFRAATRARLVAMAAVRTPAPEPVTGFRRLLAARAADAPPARWRARLTAGLAGAAMAVTATATLVAVSTDAQPGDVLYGLKRGTEQTQLALAGDTRGQTLLDFASTRLVELEELVDDGPTALPLAPAGPAEGTVVAAGADPVLVLDTLRTMDDQTTQGAAWLTERAVTTGDAGPLEDLATWSTGQSTRLTALAPRLPAEAADEAASSLALLSDISTRVTGLRPALGCADGPSVNGADALGPIPGLCVPEQAATPPSAGGTGTTPAPVPGAPTATLPPGTVPLPGGVPDPGGTTGGGGGSESSGGTGGGVEVPTGSLPIPVPSLPVPTLPVPSLQLPLPGTSGAQGSSSAGSPSSGLPLPSVNLCLPPLPAIGTC